MMPKLMISEMMLMTQTLGPWLQWSMKPSPTITLIYNCRHPLHPGPCSLLPPHGAGHPQVPHTNNKRNKTLHYNKNSQAWESTQHHSYRDCPPSTRKTSFNIWQESHFNITYFILPTPPTALLKKETLLSSQTHFPFDGTLWNPFTHWIDVSGSMRCAHRPLWRFWSVSSHWLP